MAYDLQNLAHMIGPRGIGQVLGVLGPNSPDFGVYFNEARTRPALSARAPRRDAVKDAMYGVAGEGEGGGAQNKPMIDAQKQADSFMSKVRKSLESDDSEVKDGGWSGDATSPYMQPGGEVDFHVEPPESDESQGADEPEARKSLPRTGYYPGAPREKERGNRANPYDIDKPDPRTLPYQIERPGNVAKGMTRERAAQVLGW